MTEQKSDHYSFTKRLVLSRNGGVRLLELHVDADGPLRLWLAMGGEPPREILVEPRDVIAHEWRHRAFVETGLSDAEASECLGGWLIEPHPHIPEW